MINEATSKTPHFDLEDIQLNSIFCIFFFIDLFGVRQTSDNAEGMHFLHFANMLAERDRIDWHMVDMMAIITASRPIATAWVFHITWRYHCNLWSYASLSLFFYLWRDFIFFLVIKRIGPTWLESTRDQLRLSWLSGFLLYTRNNSVPSPTSNIFSCLRYISSMFLFQLKLLLGWIYLYSDIGIVISVPIA